MPRNHRVVIFVSWVQQRPPFVDCVRSCPNDRGGMLSCPLHFLLTIHG